MGTIVTPQELLELLTSKNGLVQLNGAATGKPVKEAEEEEVEPEEPVDTTPAGMKCDIKNLYQKPDKHGRNVWVDEFPDDIHDPAENENTAKFALLIRNKKCYDSRKKLEIDSIVVQSPLLKEVLGTVLKDYPGVTTSLARLTFTAPFRPFVHRWHKLVEAIGKEENEEVKTHLKLLHSVLYGELKETISAKEDMVANNVTTFDYMWNIFAPGDLVYTVEDGQDRLFELTSADYGVNRRGEPILNISCYSIDWDGEAFGRRREVLVNNSFEGTRDITHLPAYPLEFHSNKKKLLKELLERGKTWERFAGYHYMAYKGVALGYSWCGMVKHNVESRIIIDTHAHNKFLPNRSISVNPLGKSGGPSDVFSSDEDSYDESDYSDDEAQETDGKANNNTIPAKQKLSDRQLWLAVPFVRGYALKTKKWLWFFVKSIVDIEWSDGAFKSLVLPEDQKDLILAFAESQMKNKDSFDDVIQGKGRGIILLLSGPPGVGKTLTAESVAETMRVPLYMISAGDLGLEPADIESALQNIMEMVAKWNAVLLLDEADVFLEARSSRELERNKMVSIFLRMLEYYEGILFLTTNRINNIDDAFHSRIHISMKYPDLNTSSRRHIWANFLKSSTMKNEISDEGMDKLADILLNGRQIKNVLKTSGLLAAHKGVPLRIEHINTVLAIEQRKHA